MCSTCVCVCVFWLYNPETVERPQPVESYNLSVYCAAQSVITEDTDIHPSELKQNVHVCKWALVKDTN